MRRVAAAFVVLVFALVVPPVSTGAATVEVVIGATLEPSEVRVPAGSTVGWRNADGERHRVRTTSGPAELDSGNLEPGATFRVTLSAAGTYRYVDDRDRDNPAYWGTIVVEPTGGSPPSTAPSTPAPTGPAATTPSGPSAAPDAPSSASVSIANRAFSPAAVRVGAGGSVSWANRDDRAHTVTASGRSFDSGILSAGVSFSHTFPAAGTFAYFCAVHPEMTGTVEVVAADGTVRAPAPGGAAATPAPATGAGAPIATPGERAAGGAGASSSGGAGASSSAAARSAPPSSGSVSVVDFSFRPPELTVAVGGGVTWRNTGVAPHTVTATDGGFDSGLLQPGRSFATRFPRAGTFAYRCSLHPQMQGTVVVRAGARPASTGGGGASGTANPPDDAGSPALDGASIAAEDGGRGEGRASSVPRLGEPAGTSSSSAPGPGVLPLAGAGGVGVALGAGAVAGRGALRRVLLRRR